MREYSVVSIEKEILRMKHKPISRKDRKQYNLGYKVESGKWKMENG